MATLVIGTATIAVALLGLLITVGSLWIRAELKALRSEVTGQGQQLQARIDAQSQHLGSRIENHRIKLDARIDLQGEALARTIDHQGMDLGARIDHLGGSLDAVGVTVARLEDQSRPRLIRPDA